MTRQQTTQHTSGLDEHERDEQTPGADQNEVEENAASEEPGREGDGARRPRRRWRRTRIALLIAAVLAVAAVIALRNPSPVGHWDGAEGQDRFLAAYDEAFQDLPEAAETFDVRTDYGLVRAYRFEGEGTAANPMILLPGWASSSPVWADNLPSLLEIGDVYTIDLLGSPGMSIQERPITSPDDQAAWLDQLLGELPESSFHVVGLSFGGWNAANLVHREPAHVATLTLIDPVSVFDGIPLETVVRSIPASLPWLPKSWRDSFNSYTAGGAPVEDVPVADMIEAGQQHYASKLPQPERVTEEQLASIDVPVLVIIAGESVMHEPETAIATAERVFPGSVHVYDGASHAVNGEEPDRIASDLAGFLEAEGQAT